MNGSSWATPLREQGYAVVRGVYAAADIAAMSDEMDRLKAEGLRHPATYRDRNLVYVLRSHPVLGRHLRFIHWPVYVSPLLERYRTDARQLALVGPILGPDLKQIGNQASWKTPGAEDTAFGFHQDARFRRPASAFRNLASSYVQTLIAIDPHRVENGCLKIYPGSHTRGLVDVAAEGSVLDLAFENEAVRQWGLDPDRVVNVLLEPGDVVLWLPHTLHASGPNRSGLDRRAFINGYVMADQCDRGEWAFRGGRPCEVGEPVLVQYEELYTRPEPHYVEGPLYPGRS